MARLEETTSLYRAMWRGFVAGVRTAGKAGYLAST